MHRNRHYQIRKSLFPLASGLLLFLGISEGTAWATVTEIGPADDLIAAVNNLKAGDELVLQGGTYNLSPKFTIGVSGTAQAPIMIRAKDGEVPVITRPDANQNTINIENNAYLILKGIEVKGGSHGIRLNNASFITIENCHIHDTDDVGLSANVPNSKYEGLRLLRNHIHHTNNTGEGMYLGCNTNACQMWDSLIEGNYIHDTTNPSVQQGDGIEIKEGSYNNIVRDNVIHTTNYPCIITYSTVGNGAPNIIERNVLWNCGDHAIQSAADTTIRNNIILSANADAIHNQQHQSGSPANLIIIHNTILKAGGDAIRTDNIVGPVLIANNAIYAQNGSAIRASGDVAKLVVSGNYGTGGLQNVMSGFSAMGNLANDFKGANFNGAPPNDVFPSAGSPLIGGGDATHVALDDFNGTPREGAADVGAYKFDPNGNPGWILEADFKDLIPQGAGGNGSGGSGSGGNSNGAGGNGSGGNTSGSGGAQNGAEPEDEGGCGCRAAGTPSRNTSLWLAVSIAAFALFTRARRSSP